MCAQTGEAWETVLKPKVRGAANLDALSRGVPDLQFFVVFSSIITAIGNPGDGIPPPRHPAMPDEGT